MPIQILALCPITELTSAFLVIVVLPIMLIDISPTLQNDMPGWPGDTPFGCRRVAEIGPACPVNVSSFTTSVHIGAHADAPNHFTRDGLDIASLAPDIFIGACVLIDARSAKGPLITPDDVLQQLPIAVERVLIRQYDAYPKIWDAALKGLQPELIGELARRGCRLIGVDAASVDPADSKSLDAHHACDRNGICIIEGLLLDGVPPGEYELIALPMKLAGSDAAPVRAILRTTVNSPKQGARP